MFPPKKALKTSQQSNDSRLMTVNCWRQSTGGRGCTKEVVYLGSCEFGGCEDRVVQKGFYICVVVNFGVVVMELL